MGWLVFRMCIGALLGAVAGYCVGAVLAQFVINPGLRRHNLTPVLNSLFVGAWCTGAGICAGGLAGIFFPRITGGPEAKIMARVLGALQVLCVGAAVFFTLLWRDSP